ncbi:MAG: hypothetical protein ACJAT2_000767 [Bacteriovoracaceae bacterium]|jgi:hypothetical protein
MEKNWFIFKGDHHLGPFSSEELVKMLQHEKVLPDDLIWKEGEADWLPMTKHPALLAFFAPPKKEEPAPKPVVKVKPRAIETPVEATPADEMPPPLPPLPIEIEIEEEVIEPLPSFEEIEAQHLGEDLEEPPMLPELPEEEVPVDLGEPSLADEIEAEEVTEVTEEAEEEKILFDDFAIEDYQDEVEDVASDKTSEHIINPESLWEEAPKWQKGAMVFSLIVGVLMSLYFFEWEGDDYESKRFSGLSIDKRKEMEVLLTHPFKRGTRAKMALSNTGNEIWLSTNQPGEASVYLTLNSIEGRINSTSNLPIQLRSVGHLRAGGAKFRELELVKGHFLAEGEYEAQIVGYATGLKSRLVNLMKKYPFFKDFKIVKKFQPEFKLNLRFLYSTKRLEAFEKELAELSQNKRKTQVKPFKELIERHKTFGGLLSNIKILYSESLKKMKRGRDVTIFEKRYGLEVEPILRDLLLDSIKQQGKYLNTDKKKTEDYQKLIDEGKDIGILVSDIVTRTRRYSTLTNKKRAKLEGIFAPRIQEILERSSNDIKRIKSEMQDFLAN